MNKYVVMAILFLASAFAGFANPRLRSKANGTVKAGGVQYQCGTCHSPIPGPSHKYEAKELTPEGKNWMGK